MPVEALYFVPQSVSERVLSGWLSTGVWFKEGDAGVGHLSPTFRRDQVIDTGRLGAVLTDRLRAGGGKLICDAEVVGAAHGGTGSRRPPPGLLTVSTPSPATCWSTRPVRPSRRSLSGSGART